MLHANSVSLASLVISSVKLARNWAWKNAVLMAHGIGHRLGQSSECKTAEVRKERSHEELGCPKTMMKGKIETL